MRARLASVSHAMFLVILNVNCEIINNIQRIEIQKMQILQLVCGKF
jgi:hypothetical protein